jgi:hypothetical protein
MTLKEADSNFEYVLEVSIEQIALIEPDVVIVCDNGLKVFTVPFLVKIKFPLFLNVMVKILEESKSRYGLF